ncbi:MAG: DUF2335 domain-containing protein [Pseudomonadota bacterium]|uniref:DUF2335 domain-containing protein n=1 Tax=Sphingobium naphthae TaxID=1886786 RepID=UPI002B1B7658|nr:DUF2335 domain-containing protein [Pseudomonadota bacterium]
MQKLYTGSRYVTSNAPESSEPKEAKSGSKSVQIQSESVDEPNLTHILEALPEEMRGELIEVIEQTVSHRGWLPPPEMLSQYESVLPGLAERIVRLPEREQEHRHNYIERESERGFKIKRRGQDYALGAMVLLLVFSGFLAAMGSIDAAARVAIFTVVGVVGIFVMGKIVDAKSQD